MGMVVAEKWFSVHQKDDMTEDVETLNAGSMKKITCEQWLHRVHTY